MDGTKHAVHIRATTKNERNALRGSKYIQSDISHVYEQIGEDLRNDRWVLFSGTACQVDAVRKYCKRYNTQKLLLMEIVCFGVPSPMVWKDYVSYLEKENNKSVSVDFRNKKKYGWNNHIETITFEKGNCVDRDIFKKMFMSTLILRESCFQCPYKSLNRVGDITLGDSWGIKKSFPQFDDDKGVSLVLVNTQKGQNLFNSVDLACMELLQVNIKDFMQSSFVKNLEKPEQYDEFWMDYHRAEFKEIIKKYNFRDLGIKMKVKARVKYMLKPIERLFRIKK